MVIFIPIISKFNAWLNYSNYFTDNIKKISLTSDQRVIIHILKKSDENITYGYGYSDLNVEYNYLYASNISFKKNFVPSVIGILHS